MGRKQHQRVRMTCHKGINQQAEIADPVGTCADARNVWAPNGRVESRKGYVGLGVINIGTSPDGTTLTAERVIVEDVSGSSFLHYTGGTNPNFDSRPGRKSGEVGDRIYFSMDTGTTVTNSLIYPSGFFINSTAETNSNAVYAEWSYWNGSVWKALRVNQIGPDEGKVDVFQGIAGSANPGEFFTFVQPGDWTTTTVDSQTGLFIRAQLVDAGGTTLDSSVQITSLNMEMLQEFSEPLAASVVQLTNGKKMYVYAYNRRATGLSPSYNTFHILSRANPIAESHSTGLHQSAQATVTTKAQGTVAAIPEFDDVYMALDSTIYRLQLGEAPETAAVDKDDAAVGPGAPYDSAVVASSDSFPSGNIVISHNNRLFVCGGSKVTWSAPAPYHRVWPNLQFAYLAEGDKSDITGAASLGEHLVIFKQDSIWMLIDAGLDSFSLRQYTPIRIVSGIGCVSHHTIQAVRGNLLFLAEDGVYAFDGTPQVKKLSDRVEETLNTMSPGRWRFAASANWKTNSLYLLSLSSGALEGYTKTSAVDGDIPQNDITFVYDYKNDAWWIWDGFDARQWIVDETANDIEALYFINTLGHICQFGITQDDHGTAISSYFLSQRVYAGDSRLSVRGVDLNSTNRSETVTVEILPHDQATGHSSGQSIALDLTETDIEIPWASLTVANQVWSLTRRKRVKGSFRLSCDWFQVRVSHSEKYQPFSVSSIVPKYIVLGER